MGKKVKLIVEIDEKEYEKICNYDGMNITRMMSTIKNGTPLPKGHGRLIDIDNITSITLEDSLYIMEWTKGSEVSCDIEAPTIVEADKESDNETNN